MVRWYGGSVVRWYGGFISFQQRSIKTVPTLYLIEFPTKLKKSLSMLAFFLCKNLDCKSQSINKKLFSESAVIG